MEFNTIKKINILLGTIVIAIMLLVFVYLLCANLQSLQEIHTLEDKWHVLYNGVALQEQPNKKLEKYILPKTKRGDIIELEYDLQDLKIKSPGLLFDTWHSKTEVYLEDTKIYSWGSELYQKNKLLGAKRHKLSLPQSYQGKKLTISLTSSEAEAMSRMESVAIFSIEDDSIFWFNRPLLIAFSGIVFLIVGILIFIFSCIVLIKTDKFISAIALGVTLVSMGLYFLCRAKVMPLIIPNHLVYNQIEFLSLYSLPLTLLIYSYNIDYSNRSKDTRGLYKSYLAFYSTLFLLAFLLNNFTSIHYPALIKYYYGLAGLTYLIQYYLLKKIDENNSNHWVKITKIAMKIFFAGSILSIIVYNLKSIPDINNSLNTWRIFEYILSTVAFIMLFFFFIGFYQNIKSYFILDYENKALNYMAKHDTLTKLENRRSFDQKLEEIIQTKPNFPYAIIVIDLNDLKKLNDTCGHLEGDKILIDFAEILLNSKAKDITPYRIGGDEFAIFVEDLESLSTFKKSLHMSIEEFNKYNKYKISIAMGVANSKDKNSPYEILNLADQRMYEAKRELKNLRFQELKS